MINLSELNGYHNLDYPLCLVEPPSSTTNNINRAWENYSIKCYILKPDDQSLENIGQYDDCLSLFSGFIGNLMKQRAGVYSVDNKNISVERVRDIGNDNLIGVAVEFSMSIPSILISDPITPTLYSTNLWGSFSTNYGVTHSYNSAKWDSEVLALSHNLILNSDFATDSDWTKAGGATTLGGVGYIPNGGSLYQSIGMIADKTYSYTIIAKGDSVTGDLRVASGGTEVFVIENLPSDYQTYTGTFVGIGLTLLLSEGNAGDITIQSISVKEVSPESMEINNTGEGTSLSTFFSEEVNSFVFTGRQYPDTSALYTDVSFSTKNFSVFVKVFIPNNPQPPSNATLFSFPVNSSNEYFTVEIGTGAKAGKLLLLTNDSRGSESLDVTPDITPFGSPEQYGVIGVVNNYDESKITVYINNTKHDLDIYYDGSMEDSRFHFGSNHIVDAAEGFDSKGFSGSLKDLVIYDEAVSNNNALDIVSYLKNNRTK
jgi:hypothetical protein